MLARRPLAAGEIARRFPQCRPAISKHLTILKRAGLLVETREAQRRVYATDADAFRPMATFLDGLRQPPKPEETPTASSSPADVDAAKPPPTARLPATFELEFD